jgi:spore germination protein YaaH
MNVTFSKHGFTHALFFTGAFILITCLLSTTFPHSTFAATKKTVKKTAPAAKAVVVAPTTFEVSGWLPYWRAATSTADVFPHLDKLTEINPFGYTVKNDGSLYDAANLGDPNSAYAPLIAAARAQHVRIIPTVMWSNTTAIDTVLKSRTLRAQHVAAIAAMVNQNNFDGVDIDYEGKKASDKPYFTLFLKQLYAALGKKYVMCTVESRTPPQDLNTNAPLSSIQYSNDFVALNKYCDRVRFMTYDQESVDKTLNNAAGSDIYTPVADPAWVKKAIKLAEQSISPKKIEMGVATYGYEYDITPYANSSGYMYDLLWSFNPKYATQIASSIGITPMRNTSGEMAFTYTPTTTPAALPSGASPATPTTAGSQTASLGTAVAQAATNSNNLPGTLRYMTWSDSVAIAQKIALAKQLGIRGISIFKLDGGEDQNIWNVLPAK